MTSSNENDQGSSGIDVTPWLHRVDKLGDKEFAEIVAWLECPEDAQDIFYPEGMPDMLKVRLADLRHVLLIRYGHSDGPVYGHIGVIWEERNQVGKFFNQRSDSINSGLVFNSLDADTIFPLVVGELLLLGVGVRVIDGNHLVTNSTPATSIDLGTESGSAVWDAEGFTIHEDTLVPRQKVEELVSAVYKLCPNGWFRDIYPTPESWLSVGYEQT